MQPVKDRLEDIFNYIVKDGSNIKDKDEADDDNGYTIEENAAGVTFEEKAKEAAAMIVDAPATPELPRVMTPPIAEPVVAAPPVPVPADDIEALLTRAVAKDVPTRIAAPAGDLFDTVPEPADILEIAPVATPVVSPSVRVEAPVVAPVAPSEPLQEKVLETVKSEAEVVDNSVIPEMDFGGDAGETTARTPTHEWVSDAPSPQFQWFYDRKKKYLRMILIGGELPFNRWEQELTDAHCSITTSYDVIEMYEKMKEVQGWKVRVLEIHSEANRQYFLWKRFMEMFRAQAAEMEDVKVAYADAAAQKHLLDCEWYWGRLESVVKTAEAVMKTLDTGLDTLNRGVTIALQAQDRGIERYEKREQQIVPIQPSPRPPSPELDQFDSLDDDKVIFNRPTSMKKAAVGNGWDKVR